MSDTSQGEGWWIASDDKWYPPEQHPDYQSPMGSHDAKQAPETIITPTAPTPAQNADTVAMPGPTFVPPHDPLSRSGALATQEQQAFADPTYNLGPAEEPSKSRALILGLGALVLVAGLGFLAFRLLSGGSAAGGADSPEAALDQLIASINERDIVGFVDVFDPDEIDGWIGSFSSSFDQFETVSDQDEVTNELTETYASLFDSFDYEITGSRGQPVTYEVEPLDDNNRIARVRLDGIEFEVMVEDTNTAIIGSFAGDDPTAVNLSRFDGTRLELQDEPAGLATRLFVPGESAVDEFAEGAHIDLVTVQKDGKWFISIGYSILEIARQAGEFDGFPDPDFGRAFDLVENQTGGTESPEEAVLALFNSIEQLDYETIMEITDPLATPYLHDYQPLIDDNVDQAARRETVADAALRIDEPTLEISVWEGRTLVTFDNLRADSSEGEFEVDTRTWCATFDDGSGPDRQCAEDAINELLVEAGSDLDPRDFIPEQTGIVVIERNGRWYLDALGTMGYYSDQIAQVAADLSNDLNEQNGLSSETLSSEFADFFLVEGPIARLGEPATAQAESGSVGVALDLTEYPVLSSGFTSSHFAVARVATDQPGNFVGQSERALDGEEWVVVYQDALDEAGVEFPAIAAQTDGQLDVELFEPTVTEVGLDGFSGQLGGQGRPQLFYFTPEALDAEIEITGARAETISNFGSNGVVFDDPNNSSSLVVPSTSFIVSFVVVSGEPGASFTIDVSEPNFDSPPPEQEPEREPDPSSFDDSEVWEQFNELVSASGFAPVFDQQGGYFDDCGGPSDPDVNSYIWEDDAASSLVLTPFPSFDRAASSFDQLAFVSTPCDAFSDLDVTNIVEIDIDNIRIEWVFIDDPDTVIYEHYRLIGNNIVVAVDGSVEALEDQLAIMDSFDG